MSKLEALQPTATIRGIIPDSLLTVVNVQCFGSAALELTYKTPAGKVANELLYRHDESRIEIVELGRPWSRVPHFSRFGREVGLWISDGTPSLQAIRIPIFSTCQSLTFTVPVSPCA